jgi:hypothetical protein
LYTGNPLKPLYSVSYSPIQGVVVSNESARTLHGAGDNRVDQWNDTMNLQMLDFDCSEDADGVTCWDALAQPQAQHTPALLHEVAQVLAWAGRFSPAGPGPLEDGADWDFDLQVATQGPDGRFHPAHAEFDPSLGAVTLSPALSAGQKIDLSLSLSGTPGFALAFREQFGAP